MKDPQLSKRDFLKAAALLGAAVGSPSALAAPKAGAEAEAALGQELMDPKFASSDAHGFMSDAIHLGEEKGFSVTPIYQSKNVRGGYQRPPNNATVGAFEVKMKSLEGAERAVSAPCGMSIITQTLLTFLSAGDRLLVHRCVYDNVMTLLRDYLPRFGVEVEFVGYD